MKRSHTFKGYSSFCNVKTLNSSPPELQLKDAESAIKIKANRLIDNTSFTF